MKFNKTSLTLNVNESANVNVTLNSDTYLIFANVIYLKGENDDETTYSISSESIDEYHDVLTITGLTAGTGTLIAKVIDWELDEVVYETSLPITITN